ncbi:MAG TPA: homoserine O-acetyltransferase [Sedimentisphaerales bacterium]|nr:homoserine O-acetyltransferase [Sedimentisphaerales bacterium]
MCDYRVSEYRALYIFCGNDILARMDNRQDGSVGIVETKTVRVAEADLPLKLECGKSLGPIDVAYETYGALNEEGTNAVVICHALSGNAHVAGWHKKEGNSPGWWDIMVGPGKGIDTNKYFVICSNFLGGCSGTTGPGSINPATGKRYGLSFPIITIADMVHVQKLLLEKLGVRKVLAVIGGSMGGMQALQWAVAYPDIVESCLAVATTTHLGAQAIAFDAVGRNAILADPKFANGEYPPTAVPDKGLAIARMIGHITYLSEQGMRSRFGRELRNSRDYSYDFDPEFAVETYLDYQGVKFVERFDANSYLYITKAMDYFSLPRDHGSLESAFGKTDSRFLVVSFTSDWLFTPEESWDMACALLKHGKDVSYCSIFSPYGHDAFLLEPEVLGSLISGFLARTHARVRGSADRVRKSPGSVDIADTGTRLRVDYELIESLIEPGSRVLDIGCGNGELLARLVHDKGVTATGIEMEQDLIVECVNRGISVLQYDIEKGLDPCADGSFDYVILSQTLQTLKHPATVFTELLRVGKQVIVSFPNFAHWRSRLQLGLSGRAPVTSKLPYNWYDSPNIHFLSLSDFDRFCRSIGARVLRRIPLVRNRPSPVRIAPNLFAEQAIYVTAKP